MCPRGALPLPLSHRPVSVVILDYGSQYTQLIARRIRALHVYCEIHPWSVDPATLAALSPGAIILSGGPASVGDVGAPTLDPGVLALGVPVLGICYGQQLLAAHLGGRVATAHHREFGRAQVRLLPDLPPVAERLLAPFAAAGRLTAWMSHGDHVDALPPDFVAVGATDTVPYAIMAHRTQPIVGLQFHPEVTHTEGGAELIAAFVRDVAGLPPSWTMDSFLADQVAQVQRRVGPDEQVICGLSGGVDSSVVAALLARALGPRLHCIFVDNGLMRQDEADQVRATFAEAMGVPLTVVDAGPQFFAALAGVTCPEKKRKAIGRVFIEVFEAAARAIPGARYLAQGTLYPDVIESVSAAGPAVTIKSHHNVGGLPERMQLALIEPLRELFKDEVRALGLALGLPAALVHRQPFPGPGLGVRVVGEVTPERADIARRADAIVVAEVEAAGLGRAVWQAFAVLLPVRSVGVMGDGRTYDECVSVRAVESTDGMTADWSRLPYDLLARISARIINEVRGVNRVLYDISSKPPATIEWE